MEMPTTIQNVTTTQYTGGGSSDTRTITSNTHNVVLQDSQGITITKTANTNTFSVGQIITYTVQITNSSSQYFNGVRIIDNLGGGNLAYVVGSATLTVGSLTYAVTPVATSPLTFTLQELNVGGTMTLRYNSQVIFNLPTSVNSITNSVQGIGYTSTGTVSGFATRTLTRTPSSGLTVTKGSSLSEVLPNEAFNYVITYSNGTSENISLTSITDQLPTNFVVTGISYQIGSGSLITLSSTDYTLTSGNLLTIPSGTGPTITVPASGSTIITINGYLT